MQQFGLRSARKGATVVQVRLLFSQHMQSLVSNVHLPCQSNHPCCKPTMFFCPHGGCIACRSLLMCADADHRPGGLAG
jgi:hypothetical protein